jgi:solute carrier family 26 (sodium-independent sulfate anion transporter), member 11
MLVRPRHSLLCFPAVEYVRNGINKAISVHEKVTHFIVVDCRNVQELDYTAAKCLGSLKKELAAKNILMILLGPPDEVKLVLKGSLKGSNVQQVDTEHELDICLQEQSGKNELQEVVAPLLSQPDGEQDIAVAKPGSLRKD